MGAKGIVGLLSVIIFVAFCVVGTYLYRRDKAKYGGLENACNNQPVPGTPPYVPGSPATRLLAYTRASDNTWIWGLSLTPNEWMADSRANASLVVCAEEQRTVVDGQCSVTRTGRPGVGIRVLGVRVATIGRDPGTETVDISHREMQIRVVEAATGRVRGMDTLRGPEGRTCDETLPANVSASDFRGRDVGREQLSAWLTAHLPYDR